MERDLWNNACRLANVPDDLATLWFEKIIAKYTETWRHYHNEKMLKFKLNFVSQSDGGDNIQSSLIFAIFFQYYNYDVRIDCSEQNCSEFRKFFNESGGKDVSVLLWHTISGFLFA